MDLHGLWSLITADLTRARNTLPENAIGHEVVRQYEEFLGHNELDLACDMLEAYARDCPVGRDFWLALRDAATKLNLRS
jgi:hypothetical protein